MRTSKLLFTLLFTFVATLAFSQSSIYEMKDFAVYQKMHKKLAIVPIEITVDIKSTPRDITVDEIDKLHKDESLFLQEFFYAVNLNENADKRMSAEIQDVRKTNAMLEKNNVNFFNISKISKEDLAKFCEVDGIICVFFYKSNQIVNEKARNTIDSKVSVFDKNGKLLWEYYDTMFASGDKNMLYLEKIVLEKAAKKNPYRNEIKEIKN